MRVDYLIPLGALLTRQVDEGAPTRRFPLLMVAPIATFYRLERRAG